MELSGCRRLEEPDFTKLNNYILHSLPLCRKEQLNEFFLFHIVSVFQFHGFADGFFPGGINCPDDLGAYLGKEHQLG